MSEPVLTEPPEGRTTFLPFHVPSIGDDEVAAAVEVLRSGWLTSGRRVQQFESEFAAAVGVKHAVALNSCTAALHLALEAAGVAPGDEVLVPTMTFAATAEVVIYLGATPVLVDCDPVHLNLDPADVERRITPRTRAIVPVHFAGQACAMDTILEMARIRSLAVIDDAAHAFPAAYRGRSVGSLCDATCFSFYATKTITTGEGGMVTTNDERLAERVRLMSLHGISKDAWNRYARGGSWQYAVVEAGYKYNLTDIAAAIGLVQLGRHEELYRERVRLAERYRASLSDVPAVTLPWSSPEAQHAWHLFVIQIDPSRLTIDRDGFVELLRRANIGSSVHFIPLHLHPLYRDRFGYRPEDLPTANAAFQRVVSLPLFPGMTDEDVADVSRAVRWIVESHLRRG